MKQLAGNIWETKNGNMTLINAPDNITISIISAQLEKSLVQIEHERMEKIRREARERLGLCQTQ